MRVEVTDHGPGMDPAEREHAFDRFWRGREDRPGSGLGLAIVRSLVEADGGSVALREGAGGGLRVVVDLAGAGGERRALTPVPARAPGRRPWTIPYPLRVEPLPPRPQHPRVRRRLRGDSHP